MNRQTRAPAARSRTDTTRAAILDGARRTLTANPGATLGDVAAEAGVSRATVYRHFASRGALLEALDIEPDPGARERILAAALDGIAESGLRGMSMDDVAEAAGVSRASVYRLFPGKTALFTGLLDAYSPFGELEVALRRVLDQPPETAFPELLRAAAAAITPRVAIMRSLILEASVGEPEAVEAAQAAVRPLYAQLAPYFEAQVAAGRIRPVHPMLAVQTFLGPLVFNLLIQSVAGPVSGLEVDPIAAADAFAQAALRGLLP
jgi:AcrR family transcriptional regulator